MKSPKYLENLTKLIPVEIVGAFILLRNSIPQDTPSITIWALLIILLILDPLYILFAMRVKNISQILLMTLAFPIWIMCIGGIPISTLTWFEPWMGTIALVLFTLIPPMFYGQKVPPNKKVSATLFQSKKPLTPNQRDLIADLVSFIETEETGKPQQARKKEIRDVKDVIGNIDARENGDHMRRDKILEVIHNIRDIKAFEHHQNQQEIELQRAKSWREI